MARRKKGWDPHHKGGRRREAHFMDVAIDGYIRALALNCWQDYEEFIRTAGNSPEDSLAKVGEFPMAGDYRALWQEAWQQHVWPGTPEGPPHIFARMEAAVRQALLQEREERARRGDETIEDTPTYQAFVARAMNRLLEEASGENEEMD